MGTNKLALALAFLFVGCGLDTAGQNQDGDDFGSDIEPDEIEPDVPEADVAEDIEPEDAGEDEVSPDETVEDVTDIPEDAEPEDVAEDEGGEEDGEVVDPCERPDIPALGIYMFFCFADDIRADMTLSLQIERGGLPIFPWAEILGCTVTDTRSMFCGLPLYYNAVYVFNAEFEITYPGVGTGWTCGPGTDDVLWGVPRVWVNHAEQTVTTHPNMDGGCNHLFTTPPGP